MTKYWSEAAANDRTPMFCLWFDINIAQSFLSG